MVSEKKIFIFFPLKLLIFVSILTIGNTVSEHMVFEVISYTRLCELTVPILTPGSYFEQKN